LFKKYRSATDYAAADTGELEAAVKTTGFFRNQAKSIKACCGSLGGEARRESSAHDGRVARARGCGAQDGDVVLGNAFGN
jgi:endonuclease-3